MDTTEFNQKLIIPILIGVSVFVSDFATGWLSYLLGPIPMIFVLALVIGIVAGNVENGFGAFLMTLVIGNIIGALLMLSQFPQYPLSIELSLQAIATAFIIAPFYAMRISVGNLFRATDVDAFMISVIFAPGLYFAAFGFAAIGGKIGEYLRNEPEDTSELHDSGFPQKGEPINEEEIVHIVDSTN